MIVRTSLMLAVALLVGCATAQPPIAAGDGPVHLPLVDGSRGRPVPIALYGGAQGRPRPLALLSHGYGGRSTAYSFIARELVARGFVVASIQHEIAGDAEMPTQGEPAIVRRPFWERGVASLLFAARELQRRGIADLRGGVLLVGHSNGGDSSMLFAARHPELVRAVFSLDNRRHPLPRTSRPRICTARSADQPADPGVLPTAEEQQRHSMVIERIPGLIHNDMWDGAADEQKQAMLAVLRRCLTGLPSPLDGEDS